MKKLLFISTIITSCLVTLNCGGGQSSGGPNCIPTDGDTPTQGYTRLYNAVKSKNIEAIKAEMTKNTVEFAGSVAARQNAPVEKVFENGFTGTTFAETLPEIRDERVNCNMGAVEVWNAKGRIWEDLPFMLEDGKWKLAIGNLFANTYQSPGKGRAIKEAEAANAARGNAPGPATITNVNQLPIANRPPKPANANTNTAKPK